MKQKFVLEGQDQLAGRLGMQSAPEYIPSKLEGMKTISRYLIQRGGFAQQDRMIRDKRRSLDKAVLYSYQGAFVRKWAPLQEEQPPVRALINPDKVKQDYDDKIISIGYEHEFNPGDVFEWVNTDSYWLIYLQDKTELAYFRGEIRRCRYKINFKDEDGNIHQIYAAVRGPVETKINYIQKNGISVDTPNHSVNILLPDNEENRKYFNRYSEFYLLEDSKKICWRVEGIDWISMPGILQVNGIEYYSNKFQDDIDNGIAGGLILEEENPNKNLVESLIQGETFIKPKGIYTYTYTGLMTGDWAIDISKYPVEYKVIDKNTIKLRWNSSYSGQFEITRGRVTKTIVVESLF